MIIYSKYKLKSGGNDLLVYCDKGEIFCNLYHDISEVFSTSAVTLENILLRAV